MAEFKLVDKKAKLSLEEIVRFQLLTHCYLKGISLSDSEIKCLVLLSLKGEYDLTEFCDLASKNHIFKTTQTVRNCLVKMEKSGFIYKEGKNKKKIQIHPEMQLQTHGNILLNYKFAHVESEES